MTDNVSRHHPVMSKEVIDFLDLSRGYTVLDATVGGGGHAYEILKKITPEGRLIGIDADESTLPIADKTLEEFRGSFKLIHDNFRNLDHVLAAENVKSFDAILFDVGISSYQIEDRARGFAMKHDGRLDMRMDKKLAKSAYDIVNGYPQNELSRIIEHFGEERFHNRIARYIVEARVKKPIETTSELAGIVRRAVGLKFGRRIDPATRTFQAIRIEVNDELGALEEGLKEAVSLLKVGARICVISFHSLEDRIVKNLFKGYASLGILRLITKKPLRPSEEEVATNPRSRSAKLRVAERV